ncbi:MAG: helix-turn-helix domain-containing protein [Bifidobacteriaceae bacterium]|nr:helix-turn-helix domain-containing protein [Bifidobacteriaceae bacterium]
MGQGHLHLSGEERTATEKVGSEGASIRQTARHLGRSRATIRRGAARSTGK